MAGDSWRVDIYDKDSSASSPVTITLDGDGFNLSYSGDIRNKANPIITSEVKLTIAVLAASDEALLTSLAGSREGRFTLALYKVAGPITLLKWTGTFLCDTITYLDEYYPLRAELTASDDIGALQSLPYDDDGTPYASNSYKSIIQHLYTALKKLRQVGDFYSSASLFIAYANDFYSVDEPALADHLGTARIKQLTWNNPDNEGNNQIVSTYEVIRNICQVYNARLLQADGYFWLLPIGAYLADQTNISCEAVLYDGTAGSSFTLSSSSYVYETGTGKKKTKGWKNEYYQPYKQVQRTQIYYGNLALLGSNFYDLVAADTIADTDFDYPSSELLKLSGSIQLSYEDSGTPTGDARIGRAVIKITLKIGSYYLKRAVSYSDTDSVIFAGSSLAFNYTPATYGASSWETTADTYDIISPVFDRLGFFSDPATGVNIPLDVVLPQLPADLVGADFTAELYDVAADGTETLVTTNAEYFEAFIYQLRLDLVESGLVNGDEVTFSATGQALNRDILEQEAVLIGDVESPNSRGVIKVYTGSTYQASSGWKSLHTSTALPINRLAVEEIGALYNATTRGINGTLFYSIMWPHQLLKDSSYYYLPTSLSFACGSGLTQLEAFRLARDITDITSDKGTRRNTNSPVSGFGAKPETLTPISPAGADGVTSVNGVTPDGTGDVTIDAGDIEYTTGTSVAKAILDAETDVTSLQSSVIVGASDTDFVSGTTGINADKTNARVSLKIGGTEKARLAASLFTIDVDTDAPQLEATDYTKGLILRDSTAQRWRITINTSGQLVITSI